MNSLIRHIRVFLLLTALFFTANFLISWPYLTRIGFLNDDTALLLGASDLNFQGLLRLFYTTYGPEVIRPFQLIGMAIEYSLFGRNPFPYRLVSLLWLSIGQALLFIALRERTGIFGAAVAALVVGFSMAGGEARFWLADRHDLYLLVSAALGLICTEYFISEVKRTNKNRAQLILIAFGLLFSYWCAFFSNEKGSVVPIALSLYLLSRCLHSPGLEYRKYFIWKAGYILLAAANCAAYLLFRNEIVGGLVGGYTGRVLPRHLAVVHILSWLISIAEVPFRQNTAELTHFSLCVGLAALSAPLLLWWRSLPPKGRIPRGIVLVGIIIAALFIASLPSAQFLIEHDAHGTLKGRMLWLPLLVWSVVIAHLLSSKGREVIVAGLILVVGAMFAARQTAKNFTNASQYSGTVTTALVNYCSCVSLEKSSVGKLEEAPFGVHIFSEPAWAAYNAHFFGAPVCKQKDPACSIRIEREGEQSWAIPLKLSSENLALITAQLDLVPNPMNREGEEGWNVEAFDPEVIRFAAGSLPVDVWRCGKKAGGSTSFAAVFVDGRLVLATPPNAFRTPSGPYRRESRRQLCGYRMELDKAQMGPGQHRISVVGGMKNEGGRTEAVTLIDRMIDLRG